MSVDFARNGIIVGNHVSHCKSLIEGGAGIYLDGSSHMLIERNVVRENRLGIAIGVESANSSVTDNIVRDNISYLNEGYGIGISAWSPEGRVVKNTAIINNTTFGNGRSSDFGYLGELTLIGGTNTVVENNVFYASGAQSVLVYTDDNPMNPQLSYNSYYSSGASYFDWNGTRYTSFSAYRSGSGNDANSAYHDPLFVDAGTFDFHLKSGSPAIDTTSTSYVPASGELDFGGGARKKGGAVDRGAYEF